MLPPTRSLSGRGNVSWRKSMSDSRLYLKIQQGSYSLPKRVPRVNYKDMVRMVKTEPTSYRSAMSSTDSIHWKMGMEEELQSHRQNGTWELAPLPVGRSAGNSSGFILSSMMTKAILHDISAVLWLLAVHKNKISTIRTLLLLSSVGKPFASYCHCLYRQIGR